MLQGAQLIAVASSDPAAAGVDGSSLQGSDIQVQYVQLAPVSEHTATAQVSPQPPGKAAYCTSVPAAPDFPLWLPPGGGINTEAGRMFGDSVLASSENVEVRSWIHAWPQAGTGVDRDVCQQ